MRQARVLCLLLLFVAAPSFSAQPLQITNVAADRLHMSHQESVSISFMLTQNAHASLEIYDGRDRLVRRVRSSSDLSAGEHALSWDGHDDRGRPVPPEAYTFTVVVKRGKELVRWDITDATAAAELTPRSVQWDPAAGKIRYVLDAPARVNIRLGLQDNGPLLRTLIDWVARPAGLNEEIWDGWDNSKVLQLANHPKLAIVVSAFSLPRNTVLVGELADQVALFRDLPAASVRRPTSGEPMKKRMYTHGQQLLEERGDFSVQLVLPPDLPRAENGAVIVSKPIPIRMEIPDADRARAIARRFEPVFFLDGQFMYENEVGFVPFTWTWDPAGVNPGEHFLTVNLRGYEGNFGMQTVRVVVSGEGKQ